MRILFVGDVVGQGGTRFLRERLPALRRLWMPDLTVVNGENAAEGNGILPASAEDIFGCGAQVITLGNHALRRREIYDYLDREESIIRPLNFSPEAPGRGWTIFDKPGLPPVAVVNLCGTVYMDCAWENPFAAMDRILPRLEAKIILVDFHAEATSEKFSFAWDFDGRVSAVIGTHTHIQTADERILPGGTGYLTDAGMCGSFNSSLGVKPQQAVRRFRTNLPTRFESDPGPCRLSGVVLDIDPGTGKTQAIQRVNVE
jgi:metallophosphoesterase (TIGR00282 family)